MSNPAANTFYKEPENGVIRFVAGEKEVLRMETNGDIYIYGKLCESDKELVDALRYFIMTIKFPCPHCGKI